MSTAPVLVKIPVVYLRVDKGPMQGQTFELKKSQVNIGRDQENDVALLQDKKVSRRHVELHFFQGQWLIKNISSGNHLFLNGQLITEKVLLGTSRIQLGESEISISFGEPPGSLANISQARPPVLTSTAKMQSHTTSFKAAPRRPAPNTNAKPLIYLVVAIVLVTAYFAGGKNALLRSRRTDPFLADAKYVHDIRFVGRL